MQLWTLYFANFLRSQSTTIYRYCQHFKSTLETIVQYGGLWAHKIRWSRRPSEFNNPRRNCWLGRQGMKHLFCSGGVFFSNIGATSVPGDIRRQKLRTIPLLEVLAWDIFFVQTRPMRRFNLNCGEIIGPWFEAVNLMDRCRSTWSIVLLRSSLQLSHITY